MTMGLASEGTIPIDAWAEELLLARECASKAGDLIRADFGQRAITQIRGPHDVQLSADVKAHTFITNFLKDHYPSDTIISEEQVAHYHWEANRTWVVDPLDGTNNFGYGIAHCAVALTFFESDQIKLAVVRDPILGREYFTSEAHPYKSPTARRTPLRNATLSLVSGYSESSRSEAVRVQSRLSDQCKRILNLWAPALDLALVAEGAIDAMVCLGADLLDVCAGVFLVNSSGGSILGIDGRPLELKKSLHQRPVSFIAARDLSLCLELLPYLH